MDLAMYTVDFAHHLHMLVRIFFFSNRMMYSEMSAKFDLQSPLRRHLI